MKSKILLLAASLLTVFVSLAQYPNLVFSSQQPKAGEKIHFEYSPAGTVLDDVKDFEAIAYLQDGQVRAQDVILTPMGDKWLGDILTNDSTKAVFVVFKKEEAVDNNKEQGYSLMIYENGQPVKGAHIAIADISGGLGQYLMQLKVDPASVVELYEKEFNRYPDLKEKYFVSYASSLVRADKDKAKEKIQQMIEELLNKSNLTENDYQSALGAYSTIKEKEKADKLKEEIKKKFPDGSVVKSEQVSKFYEEQDLAKKESLLQAYIKKYKPKTDNDKRTINYMYSSLASQAATKKNFAIMKKYAAKMTDKSNLASTYNNVAWNLVGQGMEGKVIDLKTAKDLSYKSLQLLQAEMKNPSNATPFYTSRQNKQQAEYSYGMFSDTYALILWKLHQPGEAYIYQEKAVTKMKRNDVEANERYIIYKEKVKGYDAVKGEIEEFIKKGKSSPKMKEILKKNYLAKGGTETAYNDYLEEMMREYRAKMKEELMKKLIVQAAPGFLLKDLGGNAVSLAELKGKVVVVDFWATWCGPCRASFPGMQRTVDKYKNDPEVRFVFVDSWEGKKPEEMQKNADEFIKKNNYTFQVLIDADDKVIQSYSVDGIPTKFVIDKNNNIRFKSIGFSGNADQLVDEMTMVIDHLKKNEAGEGKKGF